MDYWHKEFLNARSMLDDMLYTVKGYCYASEIGSGEINEGMRIKLIAIKADIKSDRKKSILHEKYKYYALLIYNTIGVR